MSVGFSPGDLVMLINGFCKLTEILRESPAQFQHLLASFDNFCLFAKRLKTVQRPSPDSDAALSHYEREICRVLSQFFSQIKRFRKYLGEGRSSNPLSLSKAIYKIDWARRVGQLEALVGDIQGLVQLISANMVIDVMDILNSRPYSIPPPVEDRFAFEDANRRMYPLSLTAVSSWKSLHDFLLHKVWPANERGVRSIVNGEYVIYNTTTRKEYLPSSPFAPSFTDVVRPRHRMEMSVIIPYVGQDIQRCPRSSCNKQMAVSALGVTCDCGFLIQVRHSSRPNPDPITLLAIGDIGENEDLGGLVTGIEHEALANTERTTQEIKDWVREHILNVSVLEHAVRGTRRSTMSDFLRVVLCHVQWETRGQILAFNGTERILKRVMERLKAVLDAYDSLPLHPIFDGAELLGWKQVSRLPDEATIRSYWLAYTQRRRHVPSSTWISQFLALLNECAMNTKHPFSPGVLMARCRTWIYSKILALESVLLLGVSKVIHANYCYLYPPREDPLLFRIASSLAVPSMLLGRFTGGLISDAAALVSPDTPRYDLAAACRILSESRPIAIKYIADGNLDGYNLDLTPGVFFQYSMFTSQSILDTWLLKYRRTLERFVHIAAAILKRYQTGELQEDGNFDYALDAFLETCQDHA